MKTKIYHRASASTCPQAAAWTFLPLIILSVWVLFGVSQAGAGNKSLVAANGYGKLESSLSCTNSGVSALKEAKNPSPTGVTSTANVNQPAAGVFVTKPAAYTPSPTGSSIVTTPPANAPTTVYCTMTTKYLTGGYKAVAAASVAAGVVADNDVLQALLPNLPRPECSDYFIDSELLPPTGTAPGIYEFNVKGHGSLGAAVRFQVFEYIPGSLGACAPQTPGPGETAGPCIDQVRAGRLIAEMLLVGPFDFDKYSCGLTIPFTYTGNPDNLYVLTDALAQSQSPELICPGTVALGCDLQYPALSAVGLCGDASDYSVGYFPAAEDLTAGVLSTVTATLYYEDGTPVDTCTFTATRPTLGFGGFRPPLAGPSTCAAPIKITSVGRTLPIKFDVPTCNGTPYLTGTPTVHIELVDNSCNSSAVIVDQGVFQIVGTEWHYQWDTSTLSKSGKYKIVVTFQDNTKKSVYVNIRK